jgi:hypothetical protein
MAAGGGQQLLRYRFQGRSNVPILEVSTKGWKPRQLVPFGECLARGWIGGWNHVFHHQ